MELKPDPLNLIHVKSVGMDRFEVTFPGATPPHKMPAAVLGHFELGKDGYFMFVPLNDTAFSYYILGLVARSLGRMNSALDDVKLN